MRKFLEFAEKGMTEWEAKREVSKLTGHERGDVTEIYLSSLRMKEADEK